MKGINCDMKRLIILMFIWLIASVSLAQPSRITSDGTEVIDYVAELEQTVAYMKNRVMALEADLEAKDLTINELKKKINNEREKTTKRGNRSSLRAVFSDKREVAERDIVLNGSREASKHHSVESDNLTSSMMALNEEIKRLTEERVALDSKIARLNRDIEQKRNKAAKLGANIEDKQSAIKELDALIDERQKELAQLKVSIDKSRSVLNELQKRIANAHKDRDRLRAQLEQMRSSLVEQRASLSRKQGMAPLKKTLLAELNALAALKAKRDYIYDQFLKKSDGRVFIKKAMAVDKRGRAIGDLKRLVQHNPSISYSAIRNSMYVIRTKLLKDIELFSRLSGGQEENK